MKEVTKGEFQAVYFKYGRERDGWGRAYWDKFFEPQPKPPMRYVIEEPPSPEHVRMTIVSDFAAKEYRLFFMTEAAEDSLYEP